jgi:hypothetical protein
MHMDYKDNWDAAARRMEAWWEGEILDRAVLAVTAPRQPRRPLPPPKDHWQRWMDPDYLVAACEADFEATYFGGEAFPTRTLLCGYAAYGNARRFAENTIWMDPVITDWGVECRVTGDVRSPAVRRSSGGHKALTGPLRTLSPVTRHPSPATWQFDPENPGWQATKRVTEALVEAGAGRWMVSIATVVTPVDALSALRGPENLCLDLLEYREQAEALRDYLIDVWFRCYDELHAIIQQRMEGSTSWLPIWSPGKSYALQCDFSCMISPRMFREFVGPELQAQTEWLDHALYHLDGPGALQHLDALLEIPGIRAIQWVPGAGAPPPLEWLPLLRRIQQAGKGLHLSLAASEVETALRELSPRGLFLATHCASVEEAEALLKCVARWAVVRRASCHFCSSVV